MFEARSHLGSVIPVGFVAFGGGKQASGAVCSRERVRVYRLLLWLFDMLADPYVELVTTDLFAGLCTCVFSHVLRVLLGTVSSVRFFRHAGESRRGPGAADRICPDECVFSRARFVVFQVYI